MLTLVGMALGLLGCLQTGNLFSQASLRPGRPHFRRLHGPHFPRLPQACGRVQPALSLCLEHSVSLGLWLDDRYYLVCLVPSRAQMMTAWEPCDLLSLQL